MNNLIVGVLNVAKHIAIRLARCFANSKEGHPCVGVRGAQVIRHGGRGGFARE